MITLGIKLNNFGPIWLWNDLFGLKCHIPMLQSPVWGGQENYGLFPQFVTFHVWMAPHISFNYDNNGQL